jgi:hypothetical protein
MEPTTARGAKEDAATRPERGTVEKVAFFIDRWSGEVSFVGDAIFDHCLPFMRPHVRTSGATVVVAREARAIRVWGSRRRCHAAQA